MTLVVRIPREIMKTPKAMEQIFAGVHGISSAPSFTEEWFEGKLQEWISFEIVGDMTGIHFYVHTLASHRNLVEAQIYAQYPQAEIMEVEDYTRKYPDNIPNQEYDLWGTEMVFMQPNAYPLRTYFEFEEAVEEKRIDPLASLAEVLSGLKPGDSIWMQFLLRPAGSEWVKEGEQLVSKMIGRKEPSAAGITFAEFLANLIKAPFEHPVWSTEVKKESKPENLMMALTPGEKDKVEAIEKKIAKLGFETIIRIIYIGRRDTFDKSLIGATLSYFRHFNTMNLNGLKPNKQVTPKVTYRIAFKTRREYLRKRAILDWYKSRAMVRNPLKQKPFILNTEEMATLFHFPTAFVEAPSLQHVEYKKGGPPPTLPISE